MGNYKVYVYAICKNEEQFVSRYMASMGEADGVYILDTGSTDNTVQKLREEGAFVTQEEIALEGIARLEAFYRSLGLATTLHESGIGSEDFDRMAERCAAMMGGVVGKFVPLQAADCKAIYELAL